MNQLSLYDIRCKLSPITAASHLEDLCSERVNVTDETAFTFQKQKRLFERHTYKTQTLMG